MSKDRERSYRFFVKPLDREVGAYIGLYLADNSMSQEETQRTYITVHGEEVRGVFELPYSFVTDIKHSQYARRVKVYVQEGEGNPRPYTLYDRKRTPRTTEGKKTVQGIKKARAGKATQS